MPGARVLRHSSASPVEGGGVGGGPTPPPPPDPDFIVGQNEREKEILIWLFLVHKLWDFWVPGPPPIPASHPLSKTLPGAPAKGRQMPAMSLARGPRDAEDWLSARGPRWIPSDGRRGSVEYPTPLPREGPSNRHADSQTFCFGAKRIRAKLCPALPPATCPHPTALPTPFAQVRGAPPSRHRSG